MAFVYIAKRARSRSLRARAAFRGSGSVWPGLRGTWTIGAHGVREACRELPRDAATIAAITLSERRDLRGAPCVPVGRELLDALLFGQLGATLFPFSASAHLLYSSDTTRNPLSSSSFTLPSSVAVSRPILILGFRSTSRYFS
jgi:hypothetical protein